jgi:hypothetical protein
MLTSNGDRFFKESLVPLESQIGGFLLFCDAAIRPLKFGSSQRVETN